MSEFRRGRLWFVVDNIDLTAEQPAEIRLWLALPVEHRGQLVRLGEIRPEPVEVFEDPLGGNRIAVWRHTDIRTGEMLRFTADFEVEVSEVRSHVDPASVEPWDTDSDEYRRYTRSEPWVEITPELAAKAAEIVDRETNPWLAARRIFDWVIREMAYEYPAMDDRGAEKSFAKRKGDCGEFSVVFMAMCRSLGIPARAVICNWFTGSGHAWAEILVPPHGWLPVDTSIAQHLLEPDTAVLGGSEGSLGVFEFTGLTTDDPSWLFGNLYPNRLIVYVGNNVEIETTEAGLSRTFLFMQPGGDASLPPSIEFDGIADGVAHTSFYLWDDEATDEDAARRSAEKGLAHALYTSGARERAEPGLRAVVAEKPEDAVSWLYLGRIYSERRDWKRAEEAYRACIGGKAGSVKPVIEAWARICLGNCMDVAGNREAACVEYQGALDSGVDYQGSAEAARKHLAEPFSPEEDDG